MVHVRLGVRLDAWLLVAALGLILPVIGELSRFCFDTDSLPIRGQCSNNLSNMLTMVCKPRGGFNRDIMPAEKRGKSADPPPSSVGFPYLRQDEALTFIQKRRGGALPGQGVTCECCYHLCTYTEMMEYCANDSPSFGSRIKYSPPTAAKRLSHTPPKGHASSAGNEKQNKALYASFKDVVIRTVSTNIGDPPDI